MFDKGLDKKTDNVINAIMTKMRHEIVFMETHYIHAMYLNVTDHYFNLLIKNV